MGAHYEQTGDRHRLWFGEKKQPEPDPTSEVGYSLEIQEVDAVFVPPDAVEINAGRGGTGWEQPKIIPRTQYLAELLRDASLDFTILQGKVTSEMIRQQPYRVFILPSEDIVILVCDEEGNATYVIYHPDQLGEQPVYTRSKQELQGYIDRGNVRILHYPGDKTEWQNQLKDAIVDQPLITLVQTESIGAIEVKPLTPRLSPSRRSGEDANETIGDGWTTVQALSEQYGPSKDWFREQLDLYVGDDPAHKRSGIRSAASHGRHSYFYSPEAVSHVVAKLPDAGWYSNPPENWLAVGEALAAVGTDIANATTDVEELQAALPDHFGKYAVSQGKPS